MIVKLSFKGGVEFEVKDCLVDILGYENNVSKGKKMCMYRK